MPAVVNLEGWNKEKYPQNGTGFIIDSKGICVSNYHVVDDMVAMQIVTHDGKVYEPDSILIRNRKHDLAIFSLKNPQNVKFTAVKFSNKKPLVGESVFIIGNPMRYDWSVSTGIISARRMEYPYIAHGKELLQTTAACGQGSSGSPLFNKKGKVIGILNKKAIQAENVCFAIPVQYLDELSNDTSFLPSAFQPQAKAAQSVEDAITVSKGRMQEKKYEEAITLLQQAEKQFGKQISQRQQIDLYQNIASCYFFMDNYVKAYEYYDYVYTGLRPYLLQAYEDSAAWLKTFEKDNDLHLIVVTSFLHAALCQMQMKMYADADKWLDIAISDAYDGLHLLRHRAEIYLPYIREMHMSKALCKIFLQDMEGACKELKQAVKYGSQMAQPLMNEHCNPDGSAKELKTDDK